MSTITREFTKEQLIERAKYGIERYTKAVAGFPRHMDVAMDLELARIALASLEAEPVVWRYRYVKTGVTDSHGEPWVGDWKYMQTKEDCNDRPSYEIQALYAAPPLQAVTVPDGWALVPIEPTESMVIDGFESEPSPYGDSEEWEAYEVMSGCQQAAHRAKLCWAAMIAAAPKQENTK